MASRRRPSTVVNIWPGFVDALSALLLLLVFVVMIFTLAQVFLAQTVANRDDQLSQLNAQLDDIAAALGLERANNEALRTELQQSQERQAGLADSLTALQAQREQDQALLQDQNEQLTSVRQRRDELSRDLDERDQQLSALQQQLATSRQSLDEERALSASARAEVERLNAAIAALREQLDNISQALALEEAKRSEQEAELADLGQRLNTLLAERVNELEQYRSEFFGRLRQVLVDNPNIRIEGDRFVLPSELFFESASATLGTEGQRELDKVAATLSEVTAQMPDDLNWILRIDGHTDRRPISTERFPSNWELSTARAVSVVRYLAQRGIAEDRLAATGFGEFHPLDNSDTPEALQRNRRIEIKLTDR